MTTPVRKRVAERASYKCKYCLYPEVESLIPHQLDHIVARQHGSTDSETNLAFCCAVCNRYKGPNLTSVDPETDEITPLFNPRRQSWTNHFVIKEGQIRGMSPAGRTTSFLLRFNEEERLAERQALLATGRYGL